MGKGTARQVPGGQRKPIEIQGTAEKKPFSDDELTKLIALARRGVEKLVELQKIAVG